jgi:DNA end-binding protein Ku
MPAVVWKGFVSFGLVSFPVRLMAAARNKPLRFHLLHKKDSSRVKEVFYCREEDKPVQRQDLVKGFEVSKDEYVVVTDEELKKIAPKTARVMEILQFVKADHVDPVFLDKSYHMLPDGEIVKPYALLLEAMKKREQYAVARITMHNREHIVILRPSGNELMLHTLFFAGEVQRADVKLSPAKFSDKELQLASQLIDTLSGKFQPEHFQDEYQKNVEQLIEKKQKGERVHAPKYERPAPVVDILQALRQSLADNKARPKQATAPTRSRKHKAA